MKKLYEAVAGSPSTTLKTSCTVADERLELTDASCLPNESGIAVLGAGEDFETVTYTGKTGNTLTGVIRGVEQNATAWEAGTPVMRLFTAYDYEALRERAEEIDAVLSKKGIIRSNGEHLSADGVATADIADGAVTVEKTDFATRFPGEKFAPVPVTFTVDGNNITGSITPHDWERYYVSNVSDMIITGAQMDMQTSREANGKLVYLLNVSGQTVTFTFHKDYEWEFALYAESDTIFIPELTVYTENLAGGAVTAGKIAPKAVDEWHIADGAVTQEKLSSDVREALSGALNRKIVDMLPSSDGKVLARRSAAVTVHSSLGDNLLSTNWMILDKAVDLTPLAESKQVRMTVALSREDGEAGSYRNGEVRMRCHSDDGNKVICSLYDIDWHDGANELVLPLTKFTPQQSPAWSSVDDITIFTYTADTTAEYSMTVSDLRIVDASIQEGIDKNTIYMVEAEDPKIQNVYDEYMFIGDAWEQIGSTAVDLSGYYTKTEADEAILSQMYTIVDVVPNQHGGSGTYTDGSINYYISDGVAVVGSTDGGTASAGWSSLSLIVPSCIRLPDKRVYTVSKIAETALVCNSLTSSPEYLEAKVHIPRTVTEFGSNCFEQYYGEKGGHLYIIADGALPSGYDSSTTTVYWINDPFIAMNYYTKSEIDAKVPSMVSLEVAEYEALTVKDPDTYYLVYEEGGTA